MGRVGAGFTIGMVTGLAGGLAPVVQEFVMTFKIPDSAKRLGVAGLARQMSTGGLALGSFFALFQVRFFQTALTAPTLDACC